MTTRGPNWNAATFHLLNLMTFLRAKAKHLGIACPALPLAERTDKRREAVRRIVEVITAKGMIPLGTDVQAHLKAEGLEAALATVLADMRAIGCPSRQSHRAKAQPAAPAEQAVLPGF